MTILEIDSPKLSRSSKRILNSIFYDKILDIEEETGMFSKQQLLKNMALNLTRIIENERYSNFTIVIPHIESDDNLHPASVIPDYKLILKNYAFELKDHKPREFVIIINKAWDTINIYQALNNAKYLKENYEKYIR